MVTISAEAVVEHGGKNFRVARTSKLKGLFGLIYSFPEKVIKCPLQLVKLGAQLRNPGLRSLSF